MNKNHITKKFFFLPLSLFIFALFIGCQSRTEKQNEPQSGASSSRKTVEVTLAPFDRYPSDDTFPLVFRFSEPVAPPDRGNAENFAQVSVTPNRYGSWRWVSDSELHFEPHDSWRPKETVEVSLRGLITSDGTQGSSVNFTPDSFHLSLPPPNASLGRCELVMRNRAPLIQYPVMNVRFNYRPALKNILDYAAVTLNKGNSAEKLHLSASNPRDSMSVEFSGPDLFRPDGPIALNFELGAGVPFIGGGSLDKGLHCALKTDEDDWDKTAEKLKVAAAKPPLVNVSLSAPTRPVGYSGDGRMPLDLKFTRAWSANSAPHGKPKGITLDQGITLTPAIAGVWKTNEYVDDTISFVPAEEWPVGEHVVVTVDPNAFPAVEFRNAQAEFETPRMQARFYQLKLYTDPQNPALRQVTGTLQFSHPPKEADVERALSIRMRIEPMKDFSDPGVRSLKFTVVPDETQPWVRYVKSENIDLPDEPGDVLFGLERGVSAAQGGVPTSDAFYANVRVPSKKEIYRIESAQLSVVTKDENTIQRIASIEVSEPTAPESLLGALELYVLPDCRKKENKKLCRDRQQFGNEGLVTDEVLAKSEIVPLSPVPRDESTLPNMFHFAFQAPGKREVFIRIKKELTSQTKFALAEDYRNVRYAQPFPRSLKIMHQGALLSLTGSRKLGISVRGVKKVDYELARIMPNDVHHLVSVTSGNFAKPSFDSTQIALDQLAEKYHYTEAFPEQDPGKTYYSAVDFARFSSKGVPPRGLFVLSLHEGRAKREKDEAERQSSAENEAESNESAEDESTAQPQDLKDSRLVLLTDLGLLVKDTLSGDHNVYVMSFRSGSPVSGATVKLLGQNGVPLFTATTGPDGQAHFPPTNDFKNEKVPLVYVTEKDDDYSFLPFGRNDRQLNFSRFETGGVFNAEEAEGLRALVFSDRGIYRPGEEARFGIIVRRRNLELAGANLPLEISLRDPRGIEILRRKFAISDFGFDDFRWNSENALTGTYSLGIYLIRGKEADKQSLLGSTSFRVDEFQPDKLTVTSRYLEKTPGETANGWFSPEGKFEVHVQNLFGTAAVENKVKGTLLIHPWDGTFDAYPEYNFYSHDETSDLPSQPEDLGEVNTNAEGVADFEPDLSRFAETAFNLEFAAEAFEKDSGRSVVSTARNLVSSAPYFLGWKADGDLSFIKKGGGRKVSLVAVGPDVKARALEGVVLKLEQTTMISALVKQPNGTLIYQMTPKVSQVWNGELSIGEKGADFTLKTDEPGDFKLRAFDKEGTELAVVRYQVHGEGNTTFMADRAAEVGIRLNKYSVEPNDDLEISINTPYVGSGLITIERDKVYAAQWFKSDTLSSVQHIKVPAGIVGNAYVSVAFVRSLDSKDIFASPLSYGVKPFSIARSQYTTSVELSYPPKAKPGEDLEVHYHVSEPGKVLLYAVDEGILQFAHYKNPEPVQSFVPKRALEVDTYQILDLILPDQKIVEELSSAGGDEDVGLGKFKNPFARKRRAPMAFWSGVLPEAAEGTVKIPIPEYFNGTVRLIAIQAGPKKLGAAVGQTVAQHDFVIDPQSPYFVSPGDEFEVGATVANTVQGSGKDVSVHLTVKPSAGFEAVDKNNLDLVIPEGEDRSFRVKLRAKDVLGEQQFAIQATGIGKSDSASETISMRPPQALRTTLSGGIYRPKRDDASAEKQLESLRVLYPELRDVTAAISSSPLTVAQGLVTYLKGYPYGCTEQLVSSAFPAVLFGTDPELGFSAKDVERYTKRAFQALSSRQRADGSFGLWDAASASNSLFSVYAVHFLMEAKAHSLEIPEQVLARGKAWLVTFGATTTYDDYSQLAQAYALYLRALDGERVTKEAQTLVSELDRQWQSKWRETSIAIFLAGTFKQLQMDTEADALLKRPPQVWAPTMGWPMSDPAMHGSIYAWISSKHFPKETWMSPLDTVLGVSSMIDSKSFTSFNASFALMGLRAVGDVLSEDQKSYLKVLTQAASAAPAPLELYGTRILRGDVPVNASKVIFRGKPDQLYFYGLSETGFDHTQAEPYSSGLTIERELRNEQGNKKADYNLDEKLEVTLFIKANEPLKDMALLELIPGGFEIDLGDEGLASRQSIKEGPNTWHPTFIDIQEDRIIFFGDLPKDTATFTYRLKPLSRGKYTFAAPYAEGMYDPSKRCQGTASSVEVK